MNKNKLIRMGVYAGIGAGVGALIGFGIDRAIKKHKNNKQEVKEEVREVVKERKSSSDAVKIAGIVFGSVIALSLIETCSAYLLMKLQLDKDMYDAITDNRNFNEMNFVMLLCHICETDTTMSVEDKITELTKIIDSKMLGDAAVGILKEQLNTIMEVK